MSSRSRWIILSLAILGLAFASSSAWVHYKLLTDASYQSPCDINQTFNCSKVYLSSYGSVAGVPVALGGVFWFALVAMIAWFAKPAPASTGAGSGAASGKAPAASYLFALSTVGLAVILYLAYTSWFVLKTACPLCLGTYVSVLGIFLASGAASTVAVRELPARFFGDSSKALRDPIVLVLLVALLAGTGYAAVNFPSEGTIPTPEATTAQGTDDFASQWAKQPRVDLGIPADGAKVVVVKFNDYECPGCGITYSWYKPVLEAFAKSDPGAVKMVVKDWPWNGKCNFNMAPNSPSHPGACEAAAAVRMGRDKSPAKEVEMQEWLYANQQGMTPETVKAAAERILGVKDFAHQYTLKVPDIQKDVADGTALHVVSTPTLFINGVRVDGGPKGQLMPPAYFEMAIQIELKKAAGK